MRFYLIIRARSKTPFVLTPPRFCQRDDQISLTTNFSQRFRCILTVFSCFYLPSDLCVCVYVGNFLRGVCGRKTRTLAMLSHSRVTSVELIYYIIYLFSGAGSYFVFFASIIWNKWKKYVFRLPTKR